MVSPAANAALSASLEVVAVPDSSVAPVMAAAPPVELRATVSLGSELMPNLASVEVDDPVKLMSASRAGGQAERTSHDRSRTAGRLVDRGQDVVDRAGGDVDRQVVARDRTGVAAAGVERDRLVVDDQVIRGGERVAADQCVRTARNLRTGQLGRRGDRSAVVDDAAGTVGGGDAERGCRGAADGDVGRGAGVDRDVTGAVDGSGDARARRQLDGVKDIAEGRGGGRSEADRGVVADDGGRGRRGAEGDGVAVDGQRLAAERGDRRGSKMGAGGGVERGAGGDRSCRTVQMSDRTGRGACDVSGLVGRNLGRTRHRVGGVDRELVVVDRAARKGRVDRRAGAEQVAGGCAVDGDADVGLGRVADGRLQRLGCD